MANLIKNAHKKTFYIDSNLRNTGTQSDFSITLNLDPDDEFTHAVVLQCLIPKSYYLIQSGSNTIQLRELASTVTVTIPPGNYSRRSFQSVLVGLLNTASPNVWTYQITYPNVAVAADTGKYTFVVSGNSGQPSFIFGSSKICEQFGFNANTTGTFVGNQLTSVNVIKMQREDAIYIHSDMVQNKEGTNVLQVVFASSETPAYSNIVYRAVDIEANSKTMATQPSNSYRFYITDENDQAIDLNGLNVIMSIMLYKQNDVSRIVEGSLKYFTLKLDDIAKGLENMKSV